MSILSKTILYYSGNFKPLEFEKKIQGIILHNCNNIPIVSVTQKPTDFGTNICVGEHGRSYLNVFRQMFIGAQTIKTEYIIFAEDDCLYPPEYFTFEPLGENFYRYDNVYILFRRSGYYKSPYACVQIVKTDYVIKVLEEGLKPHPEWVDNIRYRMFIPEIDVPTNVTYFTGPPVVILKPDGNISKGGSYVRGTKERSLLPWGDAWRVRRWYMGR
jgi:hypothetical protein